MIRLIKVSFGAQRPNRGIRQVSLHVPRGTMGLIVGSMGAGKTLVLRLCAGWSLPEEGSVLIDGRDTKEMSGTQLRRLRRTMGIASMDLPLLDTHSVLDNVGAALEVRGIRQRAAVRAALRTLETLGVLSLASARPPDLSSGERRLVALARATAARPPIVLADGPLETLPPEYVSNAVDLLSDLVSAGSCVLMSSRSGAHVPEGARVWLLRDGTIGPYQEAASQVGVHTSSLVEALLKGGWT
ncbi:ATP-binding cassette domain-containing protein [Candidatus Fermentibacteria bacterium]|nr:ATP-binding cassette domain-containing protein [Candidatus Fermentibacteria bacterium]